MPKTSFLIPSRNEKFLDNTIRDILQNCTGDVEVIVSLDGYWCDPIDDPRVIYIHKGIPMGMRAGINSCAAIAKGDYLVKIDGHCSVSKGFDEVLTSECEDNWVVIPQRRRLDAENWCEQDVGKPHIDYEYLSFPDNPSDYGGAGLNGRKWDERSREKKDELISPNIGFQGSCWMMPKKYFQKLGLMDDKNWGPFWSEAQELSFRAYLAGDGMVMTNKKAHFFHLHKGKKYGRGYSLNGSWLKQGRNMNMRFFAGEKVWQDQKYPLSWLIDQFMPMPGWSDEEVEKLKEREKLHWGK